MGGGRNLMTDVRSMVDGEYLNGRWSKVSMDAVNNLKHKGPSCLVAYMTSQHDADS